MDALLHPLVESVRKKSRVTGIRRCENGVQLKVNDGPAEDFDAVVLATHAPQSLKMLANPTKLEKEVLGKFHYQSNQAYVHLDTSQLPKRPRAWASWNYRLSADLSRSAAVTYDLSRLQGHHTHTPILQTLNPNRVIDSKTVLAELKFEHPLFTTETFASQQKHDQLNQDRKLLYCGAYWRFGFHEDGVLSALNVCKHFDIDLENLAQPCIAASTKVASNT